MTLRLFLRNQQLRFGTAILCLHLSGCDPPASLFLPTKQDHIKTNGQSPGPAPKIAEHGHQHQEKISTTSSLAEELEMVRQSVQKYEDLEETDMETSLTIAAEAGNFLLKENNNLKRDIQILSKQKSSLEDTFAGLELKLEEMTEQENTFLHKIETLQDKLHETLAQLEKEKQHRLELQNLFEENDRMQTFSLDEQKK
ncbi:hypothetical protein J6590_087998 [Homalodisca vitripennis]|nr:hypothetical protein J6590_087998 [Homalodisca vitripennis]